MPATFRGPQAFGPSQRYPTLQHITSNRLALIYLGDVCLVTKISTRRTSHERSLDPTPRPSRRSRPVSVSVRTACPGKARRGPSFSHIAGLARVVATGRTRAWLQPWLAHRRPTALEGDRGVRGREKLTPSSPLVAEAPFSIAGSLIRFSPFSRNGRAGPPLARRRGSSNLAGRRPLALARCTSADECGRSLTTARDEHPRGWALAVTSALLFRSAEAALKLGQSRWERRPRAGSRPRRRCSSKA